MADKSIEIYFDGTEWKVSTEAMEDEFEAASACLNAALALLIKKGSTEAQAVKQIIEAVTKLL